MGHAKEHHQWPTQKITPKPWGRKQLIFANVSPWAHGCLTLDIAQSYTHMFCEHTTNSKDWNKAGLVWDSGQLHLRFRDRSHLPSPPVSQPAPPQPLPSPCPIGATLTLVCYSNHARPVLTIPASSPHVLFPSMLYASGSQTPMGISIIWRAGVLFFFFFFFKFGCIRS